MRNKKSVRSEQKMGATGFVNDARRMAAALEDKEVAATGSKHLARDRVARFSGVRLSFLHALRYRPPKTIAADIYDKLCDATERKALEQIRIAEHEIATARACRIGVDDRALREASAALAKAREALWGKK